MASTDSGLILVVDDNESARYAKARVLRKAGYEVMEAGTGGDALRASLDREGLFGAGEAGEVEQNRHSLLPSLRRLKDREPHWQADHGRLMAVEALHPIEASVLADRFEQHEAEAFDQCVGWPDIVFAFHDGEEIGPRMLARIGKRAGLPPDDL